MLEVLKHETVLGNFLSPLGGLSVSADNINGQCGGLLHRYCE
jgi:hypothetical protein